MRDISVDTFAQNAKDLREAGEAEELARLSALGLICFPANRYLSLSLMDASQSLKRTEWIRPLIEALGEPAEMMSCCSTLKRVLKMKPATIARLIACLES